MDALFSHSPIYVNIAVVAVSLFVLVKAGGVLIDGAVALSRRLNISPLIIGSTVVAIGTSLAELAVNMVVITGGKDTSLIMGNILGSNLVNIGLGLGIPAMMMLVMTHVAAIEKEVVIYFAVTALLTVFALDGNLTRFEGMIFMASFLVILFITYQYATRERITKKLQEEFPDNQHTQYEHSLPKSLLNIVIGLGLLIFAAKLLVGSATGIAQSFHVSEYIIGITVIGVGTSIPEIMASIQAVRKGFTDIVIGNVFGSNIFNICFGLGLPMIFKDLAVSKTAVSDLYFINAYGLLMIFILLIEGRIFGKNKSLARTGGIVIAGIYLGYIGLKTGHII